MIFSLLDASTTTRLRDLHVPSPANLSHLELMTFYDFNVSAQHAVIPREQWAWTTFYPYELEKWISAWEKWKLPGMWNLEYFTFAEGTTLGSGSAAKFWNRDCKPPAWDCGLRPGWQAALTPALRKLAPYIASGGIRAIFLGDEPMLAGIAASNITAAADFIRGVVGPLPKIYWNDGCRPWYDGHLDPCVTRAGKNPASCWTNESKVPSSVDWVSCDEYSDPTVLAKVSTTGVQSCLPCSKIDVFSANVTNLHRS